MTNADRYIGELSRLAKDLAAIREEGERLQLAVDTAVTMVSRCKHACITITGKRGVLTRVGSDEVGARANEIQHEVDAGPCLDVGPGLATVVCPDLSAERRYPAWAARAASELGVASSISLLVYIDGTSLGCLSLYADGGERFDPSDVAVGEALAAHLAVALTAGREIDHLGLALHNRLTIGRAEGILMERLAIDEHQAFDFLRRASSHTNRKLVDVAADITRTRQLPTLD